MYIKTHSPWFSYNNLSSTRFTRVSVTRNYFESCITTVHMKILDKLKKKQARGRRTERDTNVCLTS